MTEKGESKLLHRSYAIVKNIGTLTWKKLSFKPGKICFRRKF